MLSSPASPSLSRSPVGCSRYSCSGAAPGPAEIGATLRRLDPGVFALAFLLQVLVYPVRTLRFQVLLPRDCRPRFLRLLPLSAAHILVANVLPAKVGEASIVVYMNRRCGVPASRGVAALLLSRLLDLATVAGCLGIVCVTLGWSGAYPGTPWLMPLGVTLFLLTTVFGALALRPRVMTAIPAWISRSARLGRWRLGRRLEKALGHLSEAFAEVSTRRLLKAALLSPPIWIASFLFYAILARGFGLVDLRFDEAVFGSSLAVLANLLPINGFAGLGTQETGWVLAFSVLGVARDLALETGVAAHLVLPLQSGPTGRPWTRLHGGADA